VNADALCATWTASIAQRGGAVLWDVPPAAVVTATLDHQLSQAAAATLTVDGCQLPGWLQPTPRLHELRLARGGVPTFAGPILGVGATGGQLSLAAQDRMWWVLNRRRLAAAQGDASSVVAQLVDQASQQGDVGLDVHTVATGTPYVSTNILIGSDIEAAEARWVARAGVLQVGAEPFATIATTLTERDWTEPPAVFVDGVDYVSTVVGDTTYHANPGMWGETAATLPQGDPHGDYLTRSTTWGGSGETNGRGPRRLLSSNATDGSAAITIRKGVTVGDWEAWRPGAALRVDVDTGIAGLGLRGACEITALRVETGAGGAETTLSVDAATLAT